MAVDEGYSVTPATAVPTSGLDLAKIASGRIIEARVASVADGIAVVAARHGTLQVEVAAFGDRPPAIGDAVRLQVQPVEGGGRPSVTVVDHAPAAGEATSAAVATAEDAVAVLARAVREAAAKQTGLAPLFATLAGLAAAPREGVPEQVRSLVAQLMGARLGDTATPSAEAVRRAFVGSGLFLEARTAATADPALAGDDLKARLFALRAALEKWVGATSPASAAAGAASGSAAPGSATKGGPTEIAGVRAGATGITESAARATVGRMIGAAYGPGVAGGPGGGTGSPMGSTAPSAGGVPGGAAAAPAAGGIGATGPAGGPASGGLGGAGSAVSRGEPSGTEGSSGAGTGGTLRPAPSGAPRAPTVTGAATGSATTGPSAATAEPVRASTGTVAPAAGGTPPVGPADAPPSRVAWPGATGREGDRADRVTTPPGAAGTGAGPGAGSAISGRGTPAAGEVDAVSGAAPGAATPAAGAGIVATPATGAAGSPPSSTGAVPGAVEAGAPPPGGPPASSSAAPAGPGPAASAAPAGTGTRPGDGPTGAASPPLGAWGGGTVPPPVGERAGGIPPRSIADGSATSPTGAPATAGTAFPTAAAGGVQVGVGEARSVLGAGVSGATTPVASTTAAAAGAPAPGGGSVAATVAPVGGALAGAPGPAGLLPGSPVPAPLSTILGAGGPDAAASDTPAVDVASPSPAAVPTAPSAIPAAAAADDDAVTALVRAVVSGLGIAGSLTATRPSGVGEAAAALAAIGPERELKPPPPRRGQAPRGQAALPVDGLGVGGVEDLAKRALERTEGALARIRLEQFAALDRRDVDPVRSGDGGGPQRQWTAEMPIATPAGTGVVQMTVERDGGRARAEGGKTPTAWRVRFSLDVEPLGPVHARIGFSGERLSIGLWAERPDAAARLGDEVGRLQGALEAAAIPVESIHLATGRPAADGAPAGAGRLVDVKL